MGFNYTNHHRLDSSLEEHSNSFSQSFLLLGLVGGPVKTKFSIHFKFAFLQHIECYSVNNTFISSGQCSAHWGCKKCNQMMNIHINELLEEEY